MKSRRFFRAILKRSRLGRARSLLAGLLKIGIFNKSVAKVIIDYYDGHWGQQIVRETGHLGFGFIHYALTANLCPKQVLCIGSQRGFVPAICALACKDKQRGHVDLVDAGFSRGHPKAWSGDGFWKRVDPKKHFSLLGLNKWVTLYVMTSEQFAKKYPKRKYGYIYIDGDHSYEGVKKDFELFWPQLEKGGFITFHDILGKGYWRDKWKFGVWKFWKELEKTHQSICFPKHPGLGVIQKA